MQFEITKLLEKKLHFFNNFYLKKRRSVREFTRYINRLGYSVKLIEPKNILVSKVVRTHTAQQRELTKLPSCAVFPAGHFSSLFPPGHSF